MGGKNESRLNLWAYLPLLLAMLVVLAGCGTGKTVVTRPPEAGIHVSTVDFSEVDSTVKVPEEVRERFKAELAKYLYEDGTFQRGSEFNIKYRFIQFNPGSQFSRWFWGGIGNAGEGTLTIEAKYFDESGRELAIIQSEGKIGSGFFGGSINSAVSKAAKEIADYTKSNFLK